MKIDNPASKGKETVLSETQDETVIVVCSADNNYAMPLAVTIRSAIENLAKNRKVLFFVIDGGITERNKRRILKSVNSNRCGIRWIAKPDTIINEDVIPVKITSGLPETAHITIAAWYRLLISELLPQQIKKAIYLDCDLVVTGDLGQLWEVDMENNYLLAVARLEQYEHRTIPFFLGNWKELGFSESDKYFNSGVLLFNLEKWRVDDMCGKSLDYVKLNQEYIRWVDQDVLNAIVIGYWAELDPRWNCMNPPGMTKEEVDKSFILHYALPTKPWVALEKYPALDVFYKYLQLTDWSGYQPTKSQRVWRRLKREFKKLANSN